VPVKKSKSKIVPPKKLGDGSKMLKVRGAFLRWLKKEAGRRGLFLYQMVEVAAAEGQGGRMPWGKSR